MAYDPTKPANNAPIVAAELRNQFAGLKTLIDQRAPRIGGISTLNTSWIIRLPLRTFRTCSTN